LPALAFAGENLFAAAQPGVGLELVFLGSCAKTKGAGNLPAEEKLHGGQGAGQTDIIAGQMASSGVHGPSDLIRSCQLEFAKVFVGFPHADLQAFQDAFDRNQSDADSVFEECRGGFEQQASFGRREGPEFTPTLHRGSGGRFHETVLGEGVEKLKNVFAALLFGDSEFFLQLTAEFRHGNGGFKQLPDARTYLVHAVEVVLLQTEQDRFFVDRAGQQFFAPANGAFGSDLRIRHEANDDRNWRFFVKATEGRGEFASPNPGRRSEFSETVSGSYNLNSYGVMVHGRKGGNRRRTDAFIEALRRLIRPESVVMDIGTGAGHFALAAAKLGAKHVYAIETNPIVEMAERLAADNGLNDGVTFVHGDSTNFEIPQKADVIFSDLGSALPLAGSTLEVLADAGERHLAAGGHLIPARVRVWAGAVSMPGKYSEITSPWEDVPADLDFSRARREAVNTPFKGYLGDNSLLSEPALWWELDFAEIESCHAKGDVSLPITEAGTGHALALWLEYEMCDGLCLSSAPDQPALPAYGQFLLPWTKPVELAVGDRVEASVQARYVNQEYVWSWESCIADNGGATKEEFKQTWFPRLQVKTPS